jgi:Zn-dependent protease
VLAEPERTAYDLKFRLFGFPVRVHPLFWVAAVLLGAWWLEQPGGTVYLAIWIVAVFVSLIVHELGHALAFRAFGADSHIVLWIFGGLAVPWSPVSGRWRRIVIALAGPLAGFVILAIVYFSDRYFPWALNHRYLFALYTSLFFINLYWGIMNLLPVVPLDGGRVSEEICGSLFRRNGLRVALEISLGVAGLICLYSLACEFESRRGDGWLLNLPWWVPRGSLWTAILFGMLAVQSYQLLQQARWMNSHWRDDDDDDLPPWKR